MAGTSRSREDESEWDMSKGTRTGPEPKEFFETLMELAELMKADPRGINPDLNKLGDELIGVFEDPNFRSQIQHLQKQKIHAIEMAARDISEGGQTLLSSTIGVSFREGRLMPFITPRVSTPQGNVVFSLNWKAHRASNRPTAAQDITQDQVNAALYRLSVILSKTI